VDGQQRVGQINPSDAAPQPLRGNVGYWQYFALGFGTMTGSAWVILSGSWLVEAGPGGTILGFLLGGAVMTLVGACYAELATRLPRAGTEFAYAAAFFGSRLAFTVGWFLVLYLVSVTTFEALALAWVLEVFFSNEAPHALYRAFGAPVTWLTIGVGAAGAASIFCLNYFGSRVAVASHSFLTYGFCLVALVIVAMLLWHGSIANIHPAFATMNGSSVWLGGGALFAFCAYAMNGFQAIPQAIEERSSAISLTAIAKLLVMAILAVTLFYCLVTLAASSAAPWRTLVRAQLPLLTATRALPHGQFWTTALVAATAASLFKAWNGVFMIAARLLVAMARVGLLPEKFRVLDRRFGSPALALVCITLLNAAGVFLGRGAIDSIADMAAMMLTLCYLMCCVAVLRARSRLGPAPFTVPGGALSVHGAAVGSAVMALLAFITPALQQRGVPLEWELVMIWSAAGAAVWFLFVPRSLRERQQCAFISQL
jgi:basic amino acid/polyamine antiporter, APA family